MKRTTVMLSEDVEARLRLEARRRGVSIAEVVREAVELHLPAPQPGPATLVFAIRPGDPVDASERVDDCVAGVVRRRARR